MSLTDELTRTLNHVRSALPAPTFAAIARSITNLQETQIAQHAVGVGASVSLPALADAQGKVHNLQALLAHGPLVLTFYRGGWCPYCNVSLRALQAVLGDIRALGAELVAVTPETPDHVEATTDRAGTSFQVVHDAGNGFARSLGLVFTLPEDLRPLYAEIGIDLPATNGDATFSLPIPATYIVDRNGTVAYALVEADFTRRAEPSDILAALRRLLDAPTPY